MRRAAHSRGGGGDVGDRVVLGVDGSAALGGGCGSRRSGRRSWGRPLWRPCRRRGRTARRTRSAARRRRTPQRPRVHVPRGTRKTLRSAPGPRTAVSRRRRHSRRTSPLSGPRPARARCPVRRCPNCRRRRGTPTDPRPTGPTPTGRRPTDRSPTARRPTGRSRTRSRPARRRVGRGRRRSSGSRCSSTLRRRSRSPRNRSGPRRCRSRPSRNCPAPSRAWTRRVGRRRRTGHHRTTGRCRRRRRRKGRSCCRSRPSSRRRTRGNSPAERPVVRRCRSPPARTVRRRGVPRTRSRERCRTGRGLPTGDFRSPPTSLSPRQQGAEQCGRLYPAVREEDNLQQVSGPGETGIRPPFGSLRTGIWLFVRRMFERSRRRGGLMRPLLSPPRPPLRASTRPGYRRKHQ